jgi:single-stranded-DNA-specific exonuclease
LLNALESCADLFTRFGGHAFAVGFAMPAENLDALKIGLRAYAAQHLTTEPEHCLHIHAELPLNRITPVLVGWLRKLEPFGHGNQEPLFVARRVRLLRAPKLMKERHVRLELVQESHGGIPGIATSAMRAVGWDQAARASELSLCEGCLIDVVYRIRENDHPDFGGIEIEIAGMRSSERPSQMNQAQS